MAKRETNTAKRAERERETNAQRRKREDQHRAIVNMATEIAGVIDTVRYFGCLPDTISQAIERARKGLDSPVHGIITALDVKWVQSESIENIAKALRLAADILEEKPQDGRAFSGQDEKITEAYFEIFTRVRRDYPNRAIYVDKMHLLSMAGPTFSEFLQVYRERNPRVKVKARALRRSLQRLGHRIRPDKRGRPKEK